MLRKAVSYSYSPAKRSNSGVSLYPDAYARGEAVRILFVVLYECGKLHFHGLPYPESIGLGHTLPCPIKGGRQTATSLNDMSACGASGIVSLRPASCEIGARRLFSLVFYGRTILPRGYQPPRAARISDCVAPRRRYAAHSENARTSASRSTMYAAGTSPPNGTNFTRSHIALRLRRSADSSA